MIAQSGDLGVAGYVSQGFAEGAIGYVNYSYALELAVPGGQGAQQGRLLHRADAAERRGVAAEGADQHRRERPDGVPHPEPRRRLHRHRPAHLPAVVVLLPDPADRWSPGSSTRTRARRSARSRTTPCARRSSSRRRSATRRCRSTWCRPASTRSARSPASSCRTSTSRRATTRRSRPTARTCSPRTRRSRRPATSRAPTQCPDGTGGLSNVPTAVKAVTVGGGPTGGGDTGGGRRAAADRRWSDRWRSDRWRSDAVAVRPAAVRPVVVDRRHACVRATRWRRAAPLRPATPVAPRRHGAPGDTGAAPSSAATPTGSCDPDTGCDVAVRRAAGRRRGRRGHARRR